MCVVWVIWQNRSWLRISTNIKQVSENSMISFYILVLSNMSVRSSVLQVTSVAFSVLYVVWSNERGNFTPTADPLWLLCRHYQGCQSWYRTGYQAWPLSTVLYQEVSDNLYPFTYIKTLRKKSKYIYYVFKPKKKKKMTIIDKHLEILW